MDVLLLTLGASAAGGPELSWPLQGRHKSQTSGSSRPPWALRALCSCHSERGDAFRSARLDAPAPAGCRTPSDLVSEAARGSEWEDTRLAGGLPGASAARPVTKCSPSCSTGGFCVETRSLREERGRGTSVNAPSPRQALLALAFAKARGVGPGVGLRGLLLQLCGRLRLWGELGTADVFLTHPPLGVCV